MIAFKIDHGLAVRRDVTLVVEADYRIEKNQPYQGQLHHST
jgi:hypothetical protein